MSQSLLRKTHFIAEKLRRLNDAELFNLFLEAGAWRRFKLQQLSELELEANQDLEKERIQEEERKSHKVKEEQNQ